MNLIRQINEALADLPDPTPEEIEEEKRDDAARLKAYQDEQRNGWDYSKSPDENARLNPYHA